MESSRVFILVLAFAVVTAACVQPGWTRQSQEEDKDDIWTEEGSRGPRGPRRGPRGFELTDADIDRLMRYLKENNPDKARELAKLREDDPEKFKADLRIHGGGEFSKIVMERMQMWQERRRAEFVEWLGKNYRKDAEELAKLKEQEPDLYMTKYEHIREKYWRIFEEERRNPELAEVLKEDLELKKKRDELLRQIKAAKSDRQKKMLTAELEEVVSRRFDLIVRRKQIAYERLLRWLEELKNRIKESRDEIAKWRDEEARAQNIRKRLTDLTEGAVPFKWD
ncbi:MAG: hypothetical protein JSU70_14710 [Phycisphaerales bacterium]|nr:MAG: hypothetical protein JSU70_14710 [Phycisphaerales bacterium]